MKNKQINLQYMTRLVTMLPLSEHIVMLLHTKCLLLKDQTGQLNNFNINNSKPFSLQLLCGGSVSTMIINITLRSNESMQTKVFNVEIPNVFTPSEALSYVLKTVKKCTQYKVEAEARLLRMWRLSYLPTRATSSSTNIKIL